MAKKGLGKGLNSLFNEEDIEEVTSEITKSSEGDIKKVRMSLIEPNKKQPRRHFDEEKITALQNIENEYDVWPAGNLSIYKDLSDTERMNTINALVDKAELFLLMGPITPDAAEYLEHFLDKTGTAVTVNFDRIINQSNEASEGRLNDMTRAMYVVERMGEKLPVGCNFTVCSVNDASHYITGIMQ